VVVREGAADEEGHNCGAHESSVHDGQ
jgi:hypothetical protein